MTDTTTDSVELVSIKTRAAETWDRIAARAGDEAVGQEIDPDVVREEVQATLGDAIDEAEVPLRKELARLTSDAAEDASRIARLEAARERLLVALAAERARSGREPSDRNYAEWGEAISSMPRFTKDEIYEVSWAAHHRLSELGKDERDIEIGRLSTTLLRVWHALEGEPTTASLSRAL